MTKIKICGLKSLIDVSIVNNSQPDYIGFVLAPSKRQIALEQARQLKKQLSSSIQAVGVFVNAPLEQIMEYEKEKIIDVIQLHGDEDSEYIEKLRRMSHLAIIKAFRIQNEESIKNQQKLMENPMLDGILLDAHSPAGYGGLGTSFEWKLLKGIQRPYFLAGGIGLDNIKEALSYKPYAIDVSSKVETDGVKDAEKIAKIVEIVREANRV